MSKTNRDYHQVDPATFVGEVAKAYTAYTASLSKFDATLIKALQTDPATAAVVKGKEIAVYHKWGKVSIGLSDTKSAAGTMLRMGGSQ